MSRPALLLLLPLTAALSACPPPTPDDDDDDDDDVAAVEIPDVMQHHVSADIHPTELGLQFGLSECSFEYTANLERSDTIEPCDGCEAAWDGPVTSSFSDCSGSEIAPTVRQGLALSNSDLDVWAWSEEEGTWSRTGAASRSIVGWMLEKTEEMGEGDLSLGTIDSIYTWE